MNVQQATYEKGVSCRLWWFTASSDVLPPIIRATISQYQTYEKTLCGRSFAFFSTTSYHGELPTITLKPQQPEGNGYYLRVWTTLSQCEFFQNGRFYYLHAGQAFSDVQQHFVLFVPEGETTPDGATNEMCRDDVFNKYSSPKHWINIAIAGDVDVSHKCWNWDCVHSEGNSSYASKSPQPQKIVFNPLPSPLPWADNQSKKRRTVYLPRHTHTVPRV